MESCYIQGVKIIPTYKELQENKNYTEISFDLLEIDKHYYMIYSDPNSSVYYMQVMSPSIYLLSNECITLDQFNHTKVDKKEVDKGKMEYTKGLYNLKITMNKDYRIVEWNDPEHMADIHASTVKLVNWDKNAFNTAGAMFYIKKVNGGNRKKSGTKGRRTRKNKRSRRNRRK
jgi:hypothetical protein